MKQKKIEIFRKKKNTQGKGKKVFKRAVQGLFTGLLALTVLTQLGNLYLQQKCKKIGNTVKVYDTDLRVSVTGEGKETIVLLSGMGTPEPITDFEPLAIELGKNYKVVTIEYPGYGFSGETERKRSNENIASEINETLKELKIKPPYIFMPHSISGIYAMKYMQMYPGEVQALIGIEASVPNQHKYENENPNISNGVYGLVKFCDFTGITKIINAGGDEFLNDFEASNGYTKQEINLVKKIYSKKSIGKSRIDEMRMLDENMKDLYDMQIPQNIPVLYFLSTSSCEVFQKEMKETGYPDITWAGLHEQVITNPEVQKIEYLDGSHYLHWTNAKEIAEKTTAFLKAVE